MFLLPHQASFPFLRLRLLNMEEEKKAEEEDEEKEEEDEDEVKGDVHSSSRHGLSRNLPRISMPAKRAGTGERKLFTLRESPPAHPKTANLAKCTDHPELSVRNADFCKDLRKELSAKNRANEQPPRSAKTSTPKYPPQNEYHLRSFALGASCRPMGAIVGPSGGYFGSLLGPLGALLGLSWGTLGRSWGHLGALWGPSWASLGTSWSHLGGHRSTKRAASI